MQINNIVFDLSPKSLKEVRDMYGVSVQKVDPTCQKKRCLLSYIFKMLEDKKVEVSVDTPFITITMSTTNPYSH